MNEANALTDLNVMGAMLITFAPLIAMALYVIVRTDDD